MVILFLGAVALPAIILGAFALRAVFLFQQADIDETRHRFTRAGHRVRQAADQARQEAEHRLVRAGTEELIRISVHTTEELERLGTEIPLARRLILLTPSGHTILPPGPPEERPPQDRPEGNDGSLQALHQAESLLHLDNDPERALDLLNQYLDATTSRFKGPLLHLKAICEEKLLLLEDSLVSYDTMLSETPDATGEEGIPLVFYAHLNSLRINTELSKWKQAADHLVRLKRQTEINRFDLTPLMQNHFQERILHERKILVSLMRQEGLVHESHRLDRLLDEAHDLGVFASAFRTDLLPELQLIVRRASLQESDSADNSPHYFSYRLRTIAGELRLFGTRIIRNSSGDLSGLIGYELDLPYLDSSILTPLSGEIGREQDAQIRWSQDSRKRPATLTDETSVTIQLQPPLDFKKMILSVRDPASAALYRTLQSLMLAGLILLMLGAIGLGGIAIIKGIDRELDLARLKSDFVSSISHELKSPLTSILLFGENMQRDETAGQKSRKYAQHIVRESQRLHRLIEEILDLARLEAGGRTLSLEVGDISEVVREAVDFVKPRALSEGYELDLGVDPDLTYCLFDRDAVSQITLNLLENALLHSGGEKSIQVRVRPLGNRFVATEVIDLGVGIPADIRDHLFDRFAAGRRSGGKHQGAGLGLSIARALCRAQGGELTLIPGDGQGTRFVFTVPVGRMDDPGSRSGKKA